MLPCETYTDFAGNIRVGYVRPNFEVITWATDIQQCFFWILCYSLNYWSDSVNILFAFRQLFNEFHCHIFLHLVRDFLAFAVFILCRTLRTCQVVLSFLTDCIAAASWYTRTRRHSCQVNVPLLIETICKQLNAFIALPYPLAALKLYAYQRITYKPLVIKKSNPLRQHASKKIKFAKTLAVPMHNKT